MIRRGFACIAERGSQIEFGDEELGPKLFDTGDGNPQVLVLLERGPDQSLKFLIFEQFPPGQIGEGFRGGRCQAPGVPGRSLRLLVVRAHHTGAERQDGHRGEHPAIHVSGLLGSAREPESFGFRNREMRLSIAWRVWAPGLGAPGLGAIMAMHQVLHDSVSDRDQEDRNETRRQHPTQDGNTEQDSALRPCSGRQDERDNPEDKRE